MESSIDNVIKNYTEMEKKYYDSLNENDKKILELAINHLGSSFDLIKSIGYLKFVENTK
jgi:hypothetical protein|tara:strand:- start:12 stop:188 length:177 start_codon:yes stop_codon:yes gene_type:complete